MNFVKTLGLLMVLVGYAMAVGYGSMVANYRISKLADEDELREENDELDIVRKPILGASHHTSTDPIDKTESPKLSDFNDKTEDGKSNLHNDGQKTAGGHSRVARSAGFGVKIRLPSFRHRESEEQEEDSGRFKNPKEVDDERDVYD